MSGTPWLAEQFETHRAHLRAVAYRMLGSTSEAEDAVQEAWIRLSRSDTSEVRNLGGWLTTVVARLCLDMLRSRASRREDPLDTHVPDPIVSADDAGHPEQKAVLSDSVGLALLVVLESLTPAERLAFVLHDLFAVPFEEIAPIVDRTPAAARQLASRARRRVQGGSVSGDTDRSRQREIVDAFLVASREGDFDALLQVLDPDVVLRFDRGAATSPPSMRVRGAAAVAKLGFRFTGGGWAPIRALVNGGPGLVVARNGMPGSVISLTIRNGRIAEIDILADVARVRKLDLSFLPGEQGPAT
jgi:RNA polymerase sigma-70 factor, ECF subfamily